MSDSEFTRIELKKADPHKKEFIPYDGDDKSLLWMRAFLACAELELMMNWQDYNRGKKKEDQLPWNMDNKHET